MRGERLLATRTLIRKKRRGKCDEAQSSIGPSGQKSRGKASQYDSQRATSATVRCGVGKGARGNLRDPWHELANCVKMILLMQERGIQVDQVAAVLDRAGVAALHLRPSWSQRRGHDDCRKSVWQVFRQARRWKGTR